MPRNTLKSFPTAALRRGVASFHPSSRTSVHWTPSADDRRDDGGRCVPAPPVSPVMDTPVEELEPMPAWS